ncbi:MAG: hypothetical protein HZA52_11750 [Planctomycetes bacterium]|nr:hypothetical protein [Planctomycetota bacterium]
MILKRVGALSLAKIMGVTYTAFGLLAGLFVAAVSMLGATLGSGQNALPGAGAGVFAVVFFPVLYGVIGFVGGFVVASVYNVAASAIGGVELEFTQESGKS